MGGKTEGLIVNSLGYQGPLVKQLARNTPHRFRGVMEPPVQMIKKKTVTWLEEFAIKNADSESGLGRRWKIYRLTEM